MKNIKVQIKTPVVQDMSVRYDNRYILEELARVNNKQLFKMTPYYGEVYKQGTPLNKAYFDTIRNDLLALAKEINDSRTRINIRANRKTLDVVNCNFTEINVSQDTAWRTFTAKVPAGINFIDLEWYLGSLNTDRLDSPLPFIFKINNVVKVTDYPVGYETFPDGTASSTTRIYKGSTRLSVKANDIIRFDNKIGTADMHYFDDNQPFFSVDIKGVK